MACEWGTTSCSVASGVPQTNLELWRYNRTICTGLGDRLGALLTVAALAHVANVDVEMEWCGDPQSIYPHQRAYMPQWYGFHYPLDAFLQTFEIPTNIKLVPRYSKATLAEVAYTGNELVSEEAQDQVYTLACRTTQIGRHAAPYHDFVRAYHVVGAQLRYKIAAAHRNHVVLHMRGWDTNTFAYGWEPSSFCTDKVLSGALRRGFHVVVISNNLTWASTTLQQNKVSFIQGSAFEDMGLMLSARGIIQHAPPGYSSYSNVPAMAKGIPLISTFRGPHHRFKRFLEHGDVPNEFYTCSTQKAFFQRVVAREENKLASAELSGAASASSQCDQDSEVA